MTCLFLSRSFHEEEHIDEVCQLVHCCMKWLDRILTVTHFACIMNGRETDGLANQFGYKVPKQFNHVTNDLNLFTYQVIVPIPSFETNTRNTLVTGAKAKEKVGFSFPINET